MKYKPPIYIVFFIGLIAVTFLLQKRIPKLQNKKNKIERIASLNLASDEILIDILQKAKALDKLVAVSTLADQEEYSFLSKKTLAKISHRSNTQIENLIALKPDIVFAASFNRLSLVTPIKEAGIRVNTLSDFSSIFDITQNYMAIGRAIGYEKQALDITIKMNETILSLMKEFKTDGKPIKKRPKILIWLADGTCVGNRTVIDNIINLCGGTNILNQQKVEGWQKIPREKLALMNPDWLLTVGNPKQKEQELTNLKKTPLIKDMTAVKADKVIVLSQKEMSTQSAFILKTIDHVCNRLNTTTKL